METERIASAEFPVKSFAAARRRNNKVPTATQSPPNPLRFPRRAPKASPQHSILLPHPRKPAPSSHCPPSRTGFFLSQNTNCCELQKLREPPARCSPQLPPVLARRHTLPDPNCAKLESRRDSALHSFRRSRCCPPETTRRSAPVCHPRRPATLNRSAAGQFAKASVAP